MSRRIALVWTLVLCGAVALSCLLPVAEGAARSKTRPATGPATGPRPTAAEALARVNEILRPIKPADVISVRTAEEALAKLGKAYLPAMKTALPEQKDPVRRGVLDNVILRLDWGVDPRKAVGAWIQKNVKDQPVGGLPRPQRLVDEPLLRLLPRVRFTSLVLRGRAGRRPPGPLKRNNLFVISKDAPVQHVANLKQLGRVFTKSLRAVKTNEDKKGAVRAWLQLSQEMQNDGRFAFSVHIGGVSTNTDGTSRVVGTATVQPVAGRRGSIRATLTFNREGWLTGLREKAKLTPPPE